MRKRFHLRRVIGTVTIIVGVSLVILFVPSWVWYIILAFLLIMFVYTLACIYL